MAMLAKVLILAGMALPFHAQTSGEDIAAHAQAAQEAERRNDFQTAVREFEYLARAFPENAEIQSNLGVALYFNREVERSIDIFKKSLALNSTLVAPHLFSGLAWFRLSAPDRAVPELEQAVRLSPSDVIAHTWLGYAYVAQSKYGAGVKEFQAASRLDPNNIDVWYALGQTNLEIGKGATLRLLAVAPDGGRTWQLAGEQSQLKGDRQSTLENFKGALERRPDLAKLRTLVTAMGGSVPEMSQPTRSRNEEEEKLYFQAHAAEQEARAAFQNVIQIAPDSYRAHQILADALAAEQKPDEAVAEYRTVLAAKPDLPGIHDAIGSALLGVGKQAEALAEFEAELQIQPRSASVRTNIGQVLVMMGKYDEARKELTDALQLDRPPIEIYRLLAKVDLERKDYRSAANALRRYLAIKKGDSTGYYLLARAYRGMGDKEQADQTLKLFEQTSRDVKSRNRAQRELEAQNEKKTLLDKVADPKSELAN